MIKNFKAYRLLDLESNAILELRDVQFLDKKLNGNSTNESISNTTLDVGEKSQCF